MSGLLWVRLDASFHSNQKILHLASIGAHRAIAAYVCGLSYAGSQGTDGWIPAAALPYLHARTRDAQHLVDVNLWTPHPGGWDIHDWLEYQPTMEANAARTAHARAAALARWANHEPKNPWRPRSNHRPAPDP